MSKSISLGSSSEGVLVYVGGPKTDAPVVSVNNTLNNCRIVAATTGNAGLFHSSATGYSTDKWFIYMNTSGTVTANTSDERYKEKKGESSIEDDVTILKNLTVNDFVYKEDVDNYNLLQSGVYAQEFRDLLKENNITNKGYIVIQPTQGDSISYDLDEEETDDMYYSVNYEKFIPTLMNGWKYHDEKIEALEKEVASLKEQLENK